MSRRPKEREVFARTMVALQPYAADVVLIGGWVHALYIAEFNALSEAIYTTDIDVTIPSTLAAGDRPTLVELARRAGFSADDLDRAQGTVSLSQGCEGGSIIDLDLLTEAPNPTIPVRIHGQPGLVVPGIPISASSSTTPGGPEIHATLDPPLKIRVPTLGAYVLVKALSSARRISLRKRAKDFVYLFAIIRDREMRREVLHEMPSRPDCFLRVHHLKRLLGEAPDGRES
ncbi:MAG TPA: hypothetical protein VK420_03810 [Longimicrobium sp.]|nr:hypothetical protein [Longimicrobium sp.]